MGSLLTGCATSNEGGETADAPAPQPTTAGVGEVMTVLGPVPVDSLGITMGHEHIIIGETGWSVDATWQYDRESTFKELVEIFNHLKEAHGVQSIMDATFSESDYDFELYKMLQEETGVNIILSAGWNCKGLQGSYWDDALAYGTSPDIVLGRLYETYMKELTIGKGKSDVKAGIIKISASYGEMPQFEQLALQAAAMAAKEVGCGIISHTSGSTLGPDQARALIEYGVDPKKIAIGHMGDTGDMAYVKEVLDLGVHINLDRFGLGALIYNDEERCKNVVTLLDMGYEDRLLFGTDSCMVHMGWRPNSEEQLKTVLKDWNQRDLFETWVPRMKELGVTDENLKAIFVDNPRRVLARP